MTITNKKLQARVASLNVALGRPTTPYTRDANGNTVGNTGHIMLDHAPIYGGYILRVMNASTGESNFGRMSGRISGKEMDAYLSGLVEGISILNGLIAELG